MNYRGVNGLRFNLNERNGEFVVNKIGNNIVFECMAEDGRVIYKNKTWVLSHIDDIMNAKAVNREIIFTGYRMEIANKNEWKGDIGDIVDVTIPENVSVIDKKAFEGCYNLRSVHIFGKLLKIDNGAFKDCRNLQEVVCVSKVVDKLRYIGDNAFENCVNLQSLGCKSTSYLQSAALTTIGSKAFKRCISLENVIISERVREIGDYVFEGCTSLSSCTILGDVRELVGTFFGCTMLTHVNLPTKLRVLGKEVFRTCTALSFLSIPDSVVVLGPNSFECCFSLTYLNFSDKLREIEEYAFQRCSKLEAVELPQTLTRIGNAAFDGCTSLRNVRIPKGVEYVNHFLFASCKSIEHIYLHEKIKGIQYSAFRLINPNVKIHIPMKYNKELFDIMALEHSMTIDNMYVYWSDKVCKGAEIRNIRKDETAVHFISLDASGLSPIAVENVVIPKGVTGIPEDAFRGCKLLKEIEFSDATVVGKAAFAGCYGLKEISFPHSVEEIGHSAFRNCKGLQWVSLDGVEVLGDKAFRNCVNLVSVVLHSKLYEVGEEVFRNCNSLVEIIVMDDSGTFMGGNKEIWNKMGVNSGVSIKFKDKEFIV